MAGLGWGEGQLEETAWGQGCSSGGGHRGRDRRTEGSSLQTHSRGNRAKEKLDRAQMWHVGEGTGNSKPRQGEMCFPNSSPAAGTMAQRIPATKQAAEAEERTEKENPGKAHGAAQG